MLSHIAARTTEIRLFSAVTLLSILDPVRVAEDYATVDHLSDGRLEVIIGKGNGPEQAELFGLHREQQWATTSENYRLLRKLWDTDAVTWSGPRRPDLVEAVTLPRPLQQPLRVWHGSATVARVRRAGRRVRRSAVLGQRHQPDRAVRRARRLLPRALGPPRPRPGRAVRRRRRRRACTSRRARRTPIDTYRPIFDARAAMGRSFGVEPVFTSVEDFVERSSALIGSPQQVIDKVQRYHDRLGHSVISFGADADGLTARQHRDSLELFQALGRPRAAPAHRRPAVAGVRRATTVGPATTPATSAA